MFKINLRKRHPHLRGRAGVGAKTVNKRQLVWWLNRYENFIGIAVLAHCSWKCMWAVPTV